MMVKDLNRFGMKEKVILTIGFIILSYSILRAYNLSFTHDEALTYTIVKHNTDWKFTANNHLINTYFMKVSYLFGENELILRTPNVLSHLIYIFVSFLLVTKLKGYFFQISAFLILNLSLPLLEFFSLARGYGISHSFLLVSIYFLHEFIHDSGERTRIKSALATFFASLSVLGNFTVINYLIGLNALLLIICYQRSLPTGFFLGFSKLKSSLANAWPILLYSIFFTFFSSVWLMELKNRGELYFGGTDGLWESTFISIINFSYYGHPPHIAIISFLPFLMLFIVLLLIAVLIWDYFVKKEPTFHSSLWLIVIFSVALSYIQHIVFKTPYPKDRTALFYLILVIVSIVFALNRSAFFQRSISKFAGNCLISVMTMLVIVGFFRGANLTRSFSYGEDMCTKEMMRDLYCESQYSEPSHLGVNWLFEPASNFYREAYKMESWMNTVAREPLSRYSYSYYYCYVGDTAQIPNRNELSLFKFYPETNTVLLKRKTQTRTLLYSKVIEFPAVPANSDSTSYSEVSDSLPPGRPNDLISIEITPDEEITESMRAHIIVLEPSNWQNTMVFHNQIQGRNSIVIRQSVMTEMPSPAILYRNWQSKLKIPAVKVTVNVYR
jgi:hypothetical protein